MISLKLQNLPDNPGIYLFYNQKKELIYVGKATSLKNRVKSYWQGPKTSRPIEEMLGEVKNIKWITTDSVLEAIILEGSYIKKFQPIYNVKWRDDKSWNYLALTQEKFPRLENLREHEIINQTLTKKYKKFFGPYPQLKIGETLKILRKIFQYSTCQTGQTRPCFYFQIHQCLGVCLGQISPLDYKNKVTKPLILFLSGKKTQLLKQQEKLMRAASRQQNFEEAARLRNQIKNLKTIQDAALLNKSFILDTINLNKKQMIIEGYDISNLGATGQVGSLVVFDESGPIKNQYKKFNIKKVIGQSDVDCLKEVLTRRFQHSEWPLPDYLLIDGGLPQINAIQQILQQEKISLPLISIAKGPERKRNDFFYKNLTSVQKNWVQKNKNLLIQVRDEAHRFAIQFQRSKRKIAR
ncbi:MAG TPA: UvrB/UvrC motif-containing protein [Candidatus Magasanikbacteria bacterium]|nr:UvrB/UvrC motif-containing protein [Candidatus Magasanikbacteria bacterium]